jgi:hypothetical protein
MALSALITILSTNATNTLLRSLTMDHTILLLIKARIGMVPKPIQHRIHPLAEEDTLATSEEGSYDTFICLFVNQSLQNTSMKSKFSGMTPIPPNMCFAKRKGNIKFQCKLFRLSILYAD